MTRYQLATLGLRCGALFGVTGLVVTACGAGPGRAVAAQPNSTTTVTSIDTPATAASGPAVATTKVSITNFAFNPATITVKVGTAVTWTNMDEEPHTVTDGGHVIKSPVLGNQGSTFSTMFAAPGTYNYNCSIHPFMHGVVVVTP